MSDDVKSYTTELSQAKETCQIAGCRKGSNKNLYAVDEDENENTEESVEDEEELQAWCLLEESESEQWQEVINKRTKQRASKVKQSSLMSVES